MKQTALEARLDMTPDLRYLRTQQLVAQILGIIGKHIPRDENKLLQKAHDDLFKAFHEAGVEIITDQIRAENGLPPRDERGWTRQELHLMEARRIEMLTKPITMFMPKDL